MDKKELLTDFYALLKTHKVYLGVNDNEITIFDEDTDKPILSFYYVVDTEGLDFRLSDMKRD